MHDCTHGSNRADTYTKRISYAIRPKEGGDCSRSFFFKALPSKASCKWTLKITLILSIDNLCDFFQITIISNLLITVTYNHVRI